jgi:hypothetical protein
MNTKIAEPIVHDPSVDPFEMLIKEARQLQQRDRRRRWAAVLALIIVIAAVTVVVAGGGRGPTRGSTLSSPPPSRSEAPAPVDEVTSTSLGVGTTVNSVDMLSSTFGYAIISNSQFHPTSRAYLAVTHSGGARWTFVNALPPGSYGTRPNEYVPMFHFVNGSTGYVSTAFTTGVFATTNAGASWHMVQLPGSLSGWVFNGTSMVTVSRACPPNIQSATCPAYLSLFRDGMTTTRTSVPLVAGVDAQSVVPLAMTSSGLTIIMEGVQGGGGQAGSGALMATGNQGVTWQHIADPCGIEAEGDQLITVGASRWLLSCFLGEGMNQGKSSIWQSNDGGATWRLVNRATDSSTTTGDVGNGGGVFTTIVPSDDGSLLFGAMQGAVGGVEVSRDGGTHWTSAYLDGQGGAPETLSTFGKKGALDDVEGGLIYRTTNGRNWSVLPLLPAGKYHGLPICNAGTVTATFGARHVKGIPTYYPVVFKNLGANACYLYGAPIAHAVGRTGAPVGPPAYRNVYEPTRPVVLRAFGGTASLGLSVDLNEASDLHPVQLQCDARRVTAVSFHFSSPSDFTVALPSGGGEVCPASPSTGVGSVVSGRGALSSE